MLYVYPKLSDNDLYFVRIGGSGLGNILFTYIRAYLVAKQLQAKLIWPTWPSLKLGPWIRKERDKRFYAGLFVCPNDEIKGFKKVNLLVHTKKCRFGETDNEDDSIIIYDICYMTFSDLIPNRAFIREHIINILSLKSRKSELHDFSHEINIHVRLGDFSRNYAMLKNRGVANTSTPIEWYSGIVKEISKYVNGVRFNVFSDGSDEELAELLNIPEVRRLSFGDSIADIIAISSSKLIISSGSTFSMWARFLGNSSCIAYSNQLKEHLCDAENGFEIELNSSDIPRKIIEKIKAMVK